MPALISLKLDSPADLAAIDKLAVSQGLSRNAMLCNLIQAGMGYYRDEQMRLALESATGKPVSKRAYYDLLADYADPITAESWPDFVEFSKAILTEEAI